MESIMGRLPKSGSIRWLDTPGTHKRTKDYKRQQNRSGDRHRPTGVSMGHRVPTQPHNQNHPDSRLQGSLGESKLDVQKHIPKEIQATH